MKRRTNAIRRLAVLVSDTAYYWRSGYRLSVAWDRAKRTFK